jgi:hypothetical protein
MSKANKQYLIMAFMCLVIAGLVVWASNNVDAVENILD